MNTTLLRSLIREIPDFPRPGILFKDITPLLADAEAFRAACEAMAAPFRDAAVSRVVAVESRGFLFGAVVAHRLGSGLVPVRKPGKLPFHVVRETFSLEYGVDALELHQDALVPSDRVLIVDDVLATGGTAAAASRLVRSHGAQVVGFSFLIELAFLNGRSQLDQVTDVRAVLPYA